jgi:hypothetical protein
MRLFQMHGQVFACLLLAICVAPAWGDDATPDIEQGAASPEAAVEAFLGALKKQDRKAYEAVVVQSDLAGSVFEFTVAANGFKQRMIEAYGEVGWRKFQSEEGARIRLNYNDPKFEKLEFVKEADKARAQIPGDDSELLQVVRKDGRWYVDLEASLGLESEEGSIPADGMAKALAKMTKTIVTYEAKIGDDMTVEQLDKEMGAAFFAALLSAGAKPGVRIKVNPKK